MNKTPISWKIKVFVSSSFIMLFWSTQEFLSLVFSVEECWWWSIYLICPAPAAPPETICIQLFSPSCLVCTNTPCLSHVATTVNIPGWSFFQQTLAIPLTSKDLDAFNKMKIKNDKIPCSHEECKNHSTAQLHSLVICLILFLFGYEQVMSHSGKNEQLNMALCNFHFSSFIWISHDFCAIYWPECDGREGDQ